MISWWYFMLCWRGQTPPTCWWTAPRFRPGGLSALTMLQVDGAAEQRPGGRYTPLVELEQE